MMNRSLTTADHEALAVVPDGWFHPHELPAVVRCPDYRCQRLVDRGALERRVAGTYPHLRSEYRKPPD